jgi:cytochrome P450
MLRSHAENGKPPRLRGCYAGRAVDWLFQPYRLIDKGLADCGLTFRVSLPIVGDALLTGDPALIKEIVRNKNLTGGRGTTALRPILGNDSLIVLEGERHAHHRGIIGPSFHEQVVRSHDRLTVATVIDEMGRMRPGDSFSAIELVKDITLRIIIRAIFGTQSAEKEDHVRALVEAYLRSFESPLVLFLRPLHIDLGPRSPWGAFRRNRRRLENCIREEIEGLRNGATRGNDGVLPTLLKPDETSSYAMSDSEIVSEVTSLLLFGHDTTAAAMGWAFFHIYRHPEALQTISQELATAPGDAKPDSAYRFLEACINESMRLSPVVVHVTRVAIQDTSVGGYAVKAGGRVLPCIYLAHHNPDVFPQPYTFRPERFLGNNPRHAHSFFPFGLGNRLCVGRPFALRQMTLLMATFIEHFNLELVSADEVRPERQMLLIVPSGGPKMRVMA